MKLLSLLLLVLSVPLLVAAKSATTVNPITKQIKSTQLVIEVGNIIEAPIEAIVNAANSNLAGGGGVCGAIFNAAGWDDLQTACNAYPCTQTTAGCPVGNAYITDSFALKIMVSSTLSMPLD